MITLIFVSPPPPDATAVYKEFIKDQAAEVRESDLEKTLDAEYASLNGKMLKKSPFSPEKVTALNDTIKYHVTFGNYPEDEVVHVVPIEDADMNVIQENLGGFYPNWSFWSLIEQNLDTWKQAFENLPETTRLQYIPNYQDLKDGVFGNGEIWAVENYDENALPIELAIFAANYDKNDRDINLYWRTETEVNNSHFELYRNTIRNGEDLGQVFVGKLPGHGNSNSPKEYKFEDKTIGNFVVGDIEKYTLRQVDNDGQHEDFNLEVAIGDEVVGAKYRLSQNYPNPFNPTTSVDYELPANSVVDITVYDINGQQVKNVVNGKQDKGNYSVDIDLGGFASGMYILQMQAYGPDGQQVKLDNKLMLVK